MPTKRMDAYFYALPVEKHGWCNDHMLGHIVTLHLFQVTLAGVMFRGSRSRCND